MNEAIKSMLRKYELNTLESQENALREIIQEIALLGLWRAKFFDKAAFYGGTALRILYRLDRFSEDMDFSLLEADKQFSLDKYFNSVSTELSSYGFDVKISKKEAKSNSAIESAFLKTNTLKHLMFIGSTLSTNKDKILKIKFEVDCNPPGYFSTEAKSVLLPTPFSVRTYKLEDLFASKMHALLFRKWGTRVKGRDWYDFVWYVARDTKLHLKHFQERAIQSGHMDVDSELNPEMFKGILKDKISSLDVKRAVSDISPFIKDKDQLSLWSENFFRELVEKIKFVT